MDIHGTRAVKDIVDGVQLIGSEVPLSPERELALEGLHRANKQLATEPEQMRQIHLKVGGEFQLAKDGLHRLLVDLNPEKSFLDKLRAQRIENLLGQMVVKRELQK